MYTQSQRVVKAAQSREEMEAENKEETQTTCDRVRTQARTRKGDLGITMHTKETQREKWITMA